MAWIAPRNINPGVEWGAAIVDGIDRSRVMVLIFSAKANQSPQVRREVERAISKSVPILPLRIEDIRPQGAMEFALSNTHWLDAFGAPADERLGQLAESVMALLGVKPENTEELRRRSVPVPQSVGKHRVLFSALVLTALTAAIFVVRYSWVRPAESAASPASNTTESLDSAAVSPTSAKSGSGATPANDETSKFQGRWVSVAESTPGGMASAKSVRDRDYNLVIQDHSVTHRRHPTATETVTLAGVITFLRENENQSFTLRGTDSEGVVRTWSGLYKYSDDALKLCYRETEGRGVQPMTPVVLSTTGQRGTHYVKLVHPRERKKR